MSFNSFWKKGNEGGYTNGEPNGKRTAEQTEIVYLKDYDGWFDEERTTTNRTVGSIGGKKYETTHTVIEIGEGKITKAIKKVRNLLILMRIKFLILKIVLIKENSFLLIF